MQLKELCTKSLAIVIKNGTKIIISGGFKNVNKINYQMQKF